LYQVKGETQDLEWPRQYTERSGSYAHTTTTKSQKTRSIAVRIYL